MSMTIFTNKTTNTTTKEARSTLLHIYRPRRDPRESKHENLCVQNVQNLFEKLSNKLAIYQTKEKKKVKLFQRVTFQIRGKRFCKL